MSQTSRQTCGACGHIWFPRSGKVYSPRCPNCGERFQQIVVQQQESTSGIATAGLIFSILGWFTCGLLCIPGAFLSFIGLFSRGPKGQAIAGLIVGFPGTLFFAFFGGAILLGMLGIGGAAVTTTGTAANNAIVPSIESATTVAVPIEATTVDDDDSQSVVTPTPTVVTPYTITVKEQPLINQLLLSVVVPVGSTGDQVRQWHTEILQQYKGDKNLFVNYYEGEQHYSKTIAVDEATGSGLLWLKSEPKSAEKPIRTWTDTTGSFSVEATFQGMAFGVVKLERKNGSVVNVPIEKLSQADRDWINSLKK